MIEKLFRPYLLISLVALFFICKSGRLSAQEITSKAAFAEKVYLQLDRKSYAKGETVWFKAIVAQAKDHVPSTLSRILHVELIDPFEEVVSAKRIKLQEGIGSNYFELEDYYIPGKYQVRAFTQWNLNFDPEFAFTTYIDIAGPKSSGGDEIITLIDDSEKLRLSINPQPIDSTVGKSIDVALIVDGERDSYTVRRNDAGYFLLEETLPQTAKYATVEFFTEAGKQFKKTFNVADNALDIQFLPESGNFIAGLNNLVAFKAIDHKGTGVPVSGEIVTSSGETVTAFKSDSLGMGRLYMIPKPQESYLVRLNDSLSDKNTTVNFPKVMQEGSLISVNEVGSRIAVAVKSTTKPQDSIALRVSSRGMEIGRVEQKMDQGQTALFLSKEALPQGILVFTLLDQQNQPVAERLYFNYLSTDGLPITSSMDQSIYSKREAATINLRWEGTKDSLVASASILVLPEGNNSIGLKETICSYFLLSSELKGIVEQPQRYFDSQNATRAFDLDNLMLTQGWRKYNFTAPPNDDFRHLPEQSLHIDGEIGALFNEDKMKEDVNVSLMFFGDEQYFNEQATDSLGRFYFSIPAFEGDRQRAVLQTKNSKGRQRNYSINLSPEVRPEIVFPQRHTVVESTGNGLLETQPSGIERAPVDFSGFDPNINQLDEVFIDDYEMTPQRKLVMDKYGKPDVVIDGEQLQAKEADWNYGLFPLLRQHFGEVITFLPAKDSIGITYMKPRIAVGFETVVLVDGKAVLDDHYTILPTLPASEIKSVEIIETTSKNFTRLYKEAHPTVAYSEIPIWGSILAIYTYAGNGLFTVNKSKGILKTSVKGLAAAKEFYAPTYDGPEPNQITSDRRPVTYWNPNIIISPGQEKSIKYYNSDTEGIHHVILEIITSDGRVAYQKLEYEVNPGSN